MKRRQFLGWSAASVGLAMAQESQLNESVTATATQLNTPKVGIVLSSYTGSEDHDGTPMKGLADPRPTDADLTPTQIGAMMRRAIELSAPAGGLPAVFGAEDWIVIKPSIELCYGLGPDTSDKVRHHRYLPGSVTDLRLVQALIAYLLENKCGLRITIADGSPEWSPVSESKLPVDGWTTDWGGAFGGLSYESMIADFSRRHPSIEFDLVDLNFDDTIEMPVPGRAVASRNPQGMYHVPATLQQCDRLISVAPLRTSSVSGVSLGIDNYHGAAPGARYGMPKTGLDELGTRDEVVVDFYSYHPADYVILGGSFGIEGGGAGSDDALSVHHNLILAGSNAVAVDAYGAMAMGFDPAKIGHLVLAEKKGFGSLETDLVWTRGNEIEEATRTFEKPSGLSLQEA